MRSSTAIRAALAGAAGVAAALSAFLPVERTVTLSWEWSAAPDSPPRFPHPALQLREHAPEIPGVWVSGFVDLGRASRILPIDLPPGHRVYVRSAQKPRAFRIAYPDVWDLPALKWTEWTTAGEARRFVQAAVLGPGAASPPEPLRLVYRAPLGGLLALAFLAAATVLWSWTTWWSRLGQVSPCAWATVGLVLLAGLITARLWSRTWVDRDEALLIDATRGIVRGQWAVHEFRYPQSLAYLNALAVTGLSFARAVAGRLAFHDPVSNQVFFDGVERTGRAIFDPEVFPLLYFEQSLGLLRSGYALLAGVLALVVGLWARAIAGARAGVWAALILLVQPLLHAQASYILPNVPKALVALAVVFFLRRPLQGDIRLLVAALLVGFGSSFKYNPVLLLVFLPLAWFDRPPGRRARDLGLVTLGLLLGFVVAIPSALVYPTEFITYASSEGHHYSFVGHPYFDADASLPALFHNLYVRSPHQGNYLVALLVLIGAGSVLRRTSSAAGRREAWLLLAPPTLSLAFLLAQFVQFGRNYLPFLAFAAVLAGVGADGLAGRLARATQSRAWLAPATTAAAALVVLSVGRQCLTGSGLWADPPNARAQAVEWLNRRAPLGSRILLLEPSLGTLDSVSVDISRFRVRRRIRGEAPRPEAFDYVLGAGKLGAVPASKRISFEGPGSFGLPTLYTVVKVDATLAAALSEVTSLDGQEDTVEGSESNR